MKNINLIEFGIGLLVLGAMWLCIKPAYDQMSVIATNNSTYTTGTLVTSTESSFFSFMPFILGGMLLIWLVISLVKRGGKDGS